MIKEVFQFVKKPKSHWDEEVSLGAKLGIFVKLLLWAMTISIALTPISAILDELEIIDLKEHAVNELFENLSPLIVLFAAAVVAPIIEELFFRAPLLGLRNSKYFKIWVYVFVAAFGLIHITNFEMNTKILLFTPLLVLPQINLGFFASYICMRFGYFWAVLLHGCYNFIIIGSVYLLKPFFPEIV
ncbi:CPBP family intramembrane glutamic endopeptidase [Spongiivirga citrea]|uniref:CPBP family intramembrane metalloprotease n=1 Tax=Spongiivirga citrea TaxID=1481457 RepID=A0A6M0CM24_9FLAO|nr:CPBP family intramembrane glutamic endopeptidase [Spongiivirga citrea]NER16507.1 CPBP family intramembrane metalloprotease [Spongiivirga citrea]